MRTVLADELRFLTFRRMSPAVHSHWKIYLAFGLVFTWLAGVGRYWDNPRAHWWQHAGLGSVIYVFVLAFVIWILVAPLRPQNWSYRNVLVFLTLTAPPALLYAIPVERFMPLSDARAANVWFLAVVAAWRVALYAQFLRRAAHLKIGGVIVATLLPLVITVAALTALNLEHVVFQIMGGMNPEDQTSNDGAYIFVIALSLFSMYLAPVLIVAYLVLVYQAWFGEDAVGAAGPA
jgi:hypothetical protein